MKVEMGRIKNKRNELKLGTSLTRDAHPLEYPEPVTACFNTRNPEEPKSFVFNA
jgi:hypothetical protein